MVHKKIIERELEGFGIRLNKQPPLIEFKKRDKGGITISRTHDAPKLDDETIKAILREYKINNCDINLKCDASDEDLIDVIEGNRKYIPCLYVMNKIDDITLEELNVLDKIPHYVPISAFLEWNLDELVERIWDYLDLIRIYTKPKGLEPDYYLIKNKILIQIQILQDNIIIMQISKPYVNLIIKDKYLIKMKVKLKLLKLIQILIKKKLNINYLVVLEVFFNFINSSNNHVMNNNVSSIESSQYLFKEVKICHFRINYKSEKQIKKEFKICNTMHLLFYKESFQRSLIFDFRYALVWGASVKYNPQKVGKDHQLLDEDIVQIVKKI